MFLLLPIADDNRLLRTTPIVVPVLILACAVVFVIQLVQGSAFTMGWAATPYELTRFTDLKGNLSLPDGTVIPHAPGPWPIHLTLLSCMFLHGGWLHLLGNMLFLWVFGDQIEDRLGRARFLLFYLVTGVAGTVLHVWTDSASPVPLVGASGAISGVMGAYLLACPGNRVTMLFWFIILVKTFTVPAVIVLALWFLAQFMGMGAPASGVAYGAHVGGFVAGMVLYPLLRRRRSSA